MLPKGVVAISGLLWSLALDLSVEADVCVGGVLDGAAISPGCGSVVCAARQSTFRLSS